jgi:hypothetical protein
MTSQIALFNSLGAAVASDTVTTLTLEDSLKTTPNKEKIFELGHNHNLVVLHSGNVFVNDTNSQLLIGEWRKTLTQQLFTVEEYVTHFINWFRNVKGIVETESEQNLIVETLQDHLNYINEQIAYSMLEPKDFDTTLEAIEHHLLMADYHLENLPIVENMPSNILSRHGIELSEILENTFEQFPDSKNFIDRYEKQFHILLSTWQEMPFDSTLSFVGFGSNDFYAKSVKLNLRGRYGGNVILDQEETFGSLSKGGSLSTFAQGNAIHGFLRGHEIQMRIETFSKFRDKLASAMNLSPFDQPVTQLLDEISEEIAEFSRLNYVDPVLDTISSLSLAGLAELATSLVGIEALRAASDGGPASVGGIIESLTIDRSHGIRWINKLPGRITL